MKKIPLLFLVFILTSCNSEPTSTSIPTLLATYTLSSTNTPQSLPTNTKTSTPSQTPTITPSQTPTITPSQTPTITSTPDPIGGGGNIYMNISQELIPEEYTKDNKYLGWLLSSSDGKKIIAMEKIVWSISPDGKKYLLLDYLPKEKRFTVSLDNSEQTNAIQLDESMTYYINPNFLSVLWLPNEEEILLGYEKNKPNKVLFFKVQQNGDLIKLENASKLTGEYATFLFSSPDGKLFYWQDLESHKIFVSKVDDSEQKELQTRIKSSQNIFLSPSGKYISLVDFSNKKLNGCFIYSVETDEINKLLPDAGLSGLNYCFGGNHWSPKEDVLLGMYDDDYSLLDISTGDIKPLRNAKPWLCSLARWTPDGTSILFSNCLKNEPKGSFGSVVFFGEYAETTGEVKTISVEDGAIRTYKLQGYCDAKISPNSKWVVFFNCQNDKKQVTHSSQLLNLDTGEIYPIFQNIGSQPQNKSNLKGKGWIIRAWIE